MFPSQLRDTVIRLLDPPTPEGNNWHQLAEACLNMTWEDMRWLEDAKGGARGPTFLLLLEWEKRGLLLHDFPKAMEDIGRYDVADEVKECLLQDRGPVTRMSNNTRVVNWLM